MLEQDGKDEGGDKGDKPNWLSWVSDELKNSPVAVIVTLFGGMFWIVQREVELKHYETRLDTQTKNAEIRIEMLTRLLDMEYHDDYITWRRK